MKKTKWIIELEEGKYWIESSIHCDYTVRFDRCTMFNDREEAEEWCERIHKCNVYGYAPRLREITVELK